MPRLENEEADALTNADFRHFDVKKRLPVDLENIGFKVLPMLFRAGEEYVADLEQKKGLKTSQPGAGGKKRKMGQSLRERDPW